MSVPIKAGIILLSGAAVVSSTHFMVAHFVMPDWKPIDDSKYSGKYAADHLKFLVHAEDDKSDKWWDWSHRKMYESSKGKGGFKSEKVSWGFKGDGKEENKSLKEACKRAYESDSTKIKNSDTDSLSDDEFLESQIWKYCPPLGGFPISIKEKEEAYKVPVTENPKWGQVDGVHDKLASTETNENDLFWSIREGELKDKAAEDTSNAFFKKKVGEGKLSIRSACREAYKVNKGSDENASPSKSEILKYCSLMGK